MTSYAALKAEQTTIVSRLWALIEAGRDQSAEFRAEWARLEAVNAKLADVM